MPVTIKKILRLMRITGACMLGSGILFYSQGASALPVIPMTYSGSLGYTYNYLKADAAESETSTLTATLGGSGFIWQPWFVTMGVGLAVGVSESNTNTSNIGSASTVYSGNVQFTVFPQSRFPSILILSRTDSRLENTGAIFSADDHYINTRIYLSQSYYGREGSIARFSVDHNEFKSNRSDSSSDSLNASYRTKSVTIDFRLTRIILLPSDPLQI